MKLMATTKWDDKAINYRTERAIARINIQKEWLNSIKKDRANIGRTDRQECVVCFYTDRICGQGFTSYKCAICGSEQQWHNTCVPLICLGCAKTNDICKQCGSDIELRNRAQND
jgi:hypothetical protein